MCNHPGNFRRSHGRLIAHAEEIALLNGAQREKVILNSELEQLNVHLGKCACTRVCLGAYERACMDVGRRAFSHISTRKNITNARVYTYIGNTNMMRLVQNTYDQCTLKYLASCIGKYSVLQRVVDRWVCGCLSSTPCACVIAYLYIMGVLGFALWSLFCCHTLR